MRHTAAPCPFRAALLSGAAIIAVSIAIGAAGARGSDAATSIEIVLTDPDEDDVADSQIKTRNNGHGSQRAKIEYDLQDVTPGNHYIISIEVKEVEGGGGTSVATPPLEALPPENWAARASRARSSLPRTTEPTSVD